MEIIEIPSYTRDEKVNIATTHLVPGTTLHIKGISPFEENLIMINSEGHELTLGTKTAQRIYVLPA